MTDEHLTRFLGIDFGLKRIGIAVSDPLFSFAYSLTTLQNDNTRLKKLSDIIHSKNIKKIVLGVPSDEKTSGTSIVSEVKKFKEQLIKEFNLDVIEWDETFTSVMAKDRIIESVNKKKKRKNKELIDMNSAAIILQEYLDSLK
ncbi:MAG TPA: Holliday junction resolvase RuvX [Ignavibacteriaceae bacterium]|nr:Holliday junction resolvase RuvX [Ignavibacteriaceae bacterium]